MAHTFGHIHIKAKDPRKTAQWYVDMFGARPLGERDVRGALFVPVELSGVTVNISNARPGEVMGEGDAGLHYGLEHIAINTDDLDADLARFKEQGLQIFETGETATTRMAFVEGPDNVRIELMQALS